MKKDTFIEKLTSLSREELNNFIQEKGKGPKVVNMVHYPKEEQYQPAFSYEK